MTPSIFALHAMHMWAATKAPRGPWGIHRVFDRFWQAQGWTRSAAYRWLARSLHRKEQDTHIGMMEMDECEQVIHLCRNYQTDKEVA